MNSIAVNFTGCFSLKLLTTLIGATCGYKFTGTGNDINGESATPCHVSVCCLRGFALSVWAFMCSEWLVWYILH